MFYIPEFNNLEEILEYEKKFLLVYKKSSSSSGFYQMERIKQEIDAAKKQFIQKENELNKDNDTFDTILNIG
tara:strand:+ start:625 stop:840 length:216 start_codon:yes stop_codon:yes gene_type:complete